MKYKLTEFMFKIIKYKNTNSNTQKNKKSKMRKEIIYRKRPIQFN